MSGSSSTRVTEITVGAGKRSGGRDSYVIKTHRDLANWRSAERTAYIMDKIRRMGFEEGRFRIPKPLGNDRESLTIVEQGIKGKTLFDTLVEGNAEEAVSCLEMAAEWLARLHNCRLRITPPEEFFSNEQLRLERYVSIFYRLNHPHTRKVQEIMDKVIEAEMRLYCKQKEKLIQGHGDFHPKNIFIGHDTEDPSTRFVAAIDFGGGSYPMPPALDVGAFRAQLRNQFYDNRVVLENVSEDVFLRKYLAVASNPDDDFLRQVEVFMARASLSISYYLMKVGLGHSENLWRVLVEAEHHLARFSM